MQVKKFLNQYRTYKKTLKVIERELEGINNRIDDIKAVQLGEKLGSCFNISNTIEASYLRKVNNIEELMIKKEFIMQLLDDAEFYITLPKNEEDRDILNMVFIEGENPGRLNDIATKLNLTESGVRMRVKRSLEEIENIINI